MPNMREDAVEMMAVAQLEKLGYHYLIDPAILTMSYSLSLRKESEYPWANPKAP
jgi:hypothetical protein